MIHTISVVSHLDPARLAAAPQADLLVEFGLDSLQLLDVWVHLEEALGIAEGLLGGSQATTVEVLTREAMALQKRANPDLEMSLMADPIPATPLDKHGIEALIPHRLPIRLIDMITHLEPGFSGVATRHFPEGDPHFEGHFLGDPMLPGIFIVEACAQLVGLVAASAIAGRKVGESPAIEYLASIERFKFLAPVRPGNTLVLRAELGRRTGGLLQARVGASVAGRPIAEGTLVITERAQQKNFS